MIYANLTSLPSSNRPGPPRPPQYFSPEASKALSGVNHRSLSGTSFSSPGDWPGRDQGARGRPLRAATPDVYDGQAMKAVSLLSHSCELLLPFCCRKPGESRRHAANYLLLSTSNALSSIPGEFDQCRRSHPRAGSERRPSFRLAPGTTGRQIRPTDLT